MQPSRAASAAVRYSQLVESTGEIFQTALVIALFAKPFRAAKR
jgi:hypothetical protein